MLGAPEGESPPPTLHPRPHPPGLPHVVYVPTAFGGLPMEARLWVPCQEDTALIILSSTNKSVKAVPCNKHGLLEYSQHYISRLKTKGGRGSHSIPSLLLCLLTNFEIPLTAAGASVPFPRAGALHGFILYPLQEFPKMRTRGESLAWSH